MDTPKNTAGDITEKIMKNFSEFNEDAIMVLDTKKYNALYTRIYKILSDKT